MRLRYLSLCVLTLASSLLAQPQVRRAFLGSDHQVHVVRSDGSEFIAPLEASPTVEDGKTPDLQAEAGVPRIAADGKTVAWTVSFPDCCASYPSPLELVVYRDGVIQQRIQPARHPVYDWAFAAEPDRAVLYGTLPHGEPDTVCELVSTRTGKQIALWEAGSGDKVPGWAKVLRSCVDAESEGASRRKAAARARHR